MSFTSEVKNQICKDEVDANASKAQLCALFQIRASLHMNWQGMYLSFQSENATIAKHVFQLLKQNYHVDPRLAVLKKMQLKKNNIYRIQVYEKAEEIFVCPADFGWSDLGTWGSLLTQTKRDLYGNGVIGENISLFDTHNCVVHALGKKRVVIQGLDGYIVVEKDDKLLICKLSEEQRITQFSEQDK